MQTGKCEIKILIIGAAGQIGVELVIALREKYGEQNVIASDISPEPKILQGTGPWERIDAMNASSIRERIIQLEITQIYLLAAILSATGEHNLNGAWSLNMGSLLNVLEIAKTEKLKVFWPSSIAAMAPTSTVYGISKYAGECWCKYYYEQYGVDVRSLRYPGLISYKSVPGGGTTDYTVDIFLSVVNNKNYQCFLSSDTELPMMYMLDAISATLKLMDAPPEKIRNRMSYPVSAMSFTPKQIAEKIQVYHPSFNVSYVPDRRQLIANSWPSTIDDSEARNDWHWQPSWDLDNMVDDMLTNLRNENSLTV